MAKEITGVLTNALADIHVLKEYYNSQERSLLEYVTKSIKRNLYGAIVNRFFLSMVHPDAGLELSEKEQQIVNKVLEDYVVNETDRGKIVSYKLNSKMDFSKYEINPQVASDQFARIIQYPSILNETMLMMLMIKYENAVADIYRFLLNRFPQAYLSEKSITYSELFSLNANLDELKERFVRKEIEVFMWASIEDWYKSFEKNQKVNYDFMSDVFEEFKELYQRRNLIVHNQGVVNDIYINHVSGCTSKIGDRLTVNDDYLKRAFSVTRIILIGTVWELRKTSEDIQKLINYLFEYAYECLVNQEWDIAEFAFRMLLKEDSQSNAEKVVDRINLWIALKNLHGVEAIEDEVRGLDVSAMQRKFSVAKHALLNEFDEVSNELEQELDSDIPVDCVKEWPLFIQYRESDEYTRFVEKHKDLFESNKYKPSDSATGDSDDVNDELGAEFAAHIDLD